MNKQHHFIFYQFLTDVVKKLLSIEHFGGPRKTVASGGDGGREAQLYQAYSEHRRPPAQRAAGFSRFPRVDGGWAGAIQALRRSRRPYP
jgi:hypothetical protein